MHRTNMLKTLLSFLLCYCLWQPMVAQNRFFTFNRYSTDNGMTGNKVYCTYQDAKGFIWIGGTDGLMRYDGTKFTNYFDRKGQMPAAAITKILPVSKTVMLLCFPELKEAGILDVTNLTYNKARIIAPAGIPPRSVIYPFACGKEILLLFSNTSVILKYDSAKNTFLQNNGFALPSRWNIASAYYDSTAKNCWFSCDSGLAVYSVKDKKLFSRNYNPQNWKILNEPKINDNNWSLFVDSKRKYWIISWPMYGKGGQVLNCYDNNTNTFLNDTTGWTASITKYREIRTITETRGGIIWGYGLNGLLCRLPENGVFINNKDDHTDNFGIKYESAHDLLEDREGGIWVCTDQGLYFTPPINNNILNIVGSSIPPVTHISQLQDNRVLLTTWGGGTKIFDYSALRISLKNLYEKLDAYKELEMVWCSYQHSKTNKVYIGAQHGWLGIYDPATGKIEKILDKAFDNRTIRTITELPNGDLVFGTQSGRLVRLHEKIFEPIFNCGTIIYETVLQGKNKLWLATHNKGIFLIDIETGNSLMQVQNAGITGKTLNSNIVTHLLLYKDSLLLAANGKLSIINTSTGNVKNIGITEGLPSNTIQAMQADGNNNIWMITSNGLCRYNISVKLFTRFGSKDGFSDAGIMEGPSALLKNNMLMFVGKEGSMVVFSPDSLTSNSTPADVAITDIKIGNDYYPVDSLLALPEIISSYDNNSFVISFASLNYLQGDKLVYYYKMEGLEDNWRMISSGALRVIYSYLQPGHYVFKVKAQNINGLGSDNETQIKIYIRPPYWRNYWFLSTVLFCIALLIYTVHKLRVNKLLAVEKIRTKVARDLHDDMGSTLSTINILSAMAKSKLNTDAIKTSEYIGKISENSQRMMEAMDDIVWSIKPMNDSMQRIAARMREFATNVLEAKDIEPCFAITENVYDIKLDMEARRDFFLIFKEAVNNAAKYSKATQVNVKLDTDGKILSMEVKDDGIGFNEKDADGNGLGNMQKRADALRGKLSIQSKPGEGTAIKLVIPVS